MAVLTAAASLSVLYPLGRQNRVAIANAGAARSIYADQLRELGRDRERGVIADAEAEAARLELSRRLLRADRSAESEPVAPRRTPWLALLFAILIVPIVGVGTYLLVGSPNLADDPLSQRTAETPAGIADLVKQVETHLAADPNDGRGWAVIAPIYERLGRFDDAAKALASANRLLGSTSDREAELGEAIVQRDAGKIGPDADAAFKRALTLDPKNDRARFYIAVELGQQGRRQEAIDAWTDLISGAPKDSPWLAAAEQQRNLLTSTVAPGPSASDLAAAAKETPEQRAQMIEGMVAGLAARLDQSPDDPAGWERLLRAYMVLGRPGDAEAALGKARAALAGKPDDLAKVEQAARDSGVVKDTK